MRHSVSVRRFTLLPVLAATLAACGGAPAAPPKQQLALPAATAVAIAPTATPKPTATTRPTTTPTATTAPTETPEPTATLEPTPANVSRVTGENSFARGSITQRPWMVMIDNHPDAYPQSGLDQASMVFEGLAEYGVTRFIALYQDGNTPDVNEIGPVRSTRVYFAQWAMGFHPVYAHAGGSPDGVSLAETTDQLTNFEALRLPAYTWRDMQRLAPHNLYTSSTMLRQFAADQGVQSFEEPTSGYFFDAFPAASPAEVNGITYFFLDQTFRAGFTYDAATNGYLRSMRGQPHLDRITGKQLWTRNVVVMQVNEAARVGDDKQRIDQEVIGSGPARVFLAGRAVEATWHKEHESAPLRFLDPAGQEIVFNTGPIWVAAIPSLDQLGVQ